MRACGGLEAGRWAPFPRRFVALCEAFCARRDPAHIAIRLPGLSRRVWAVASTETGRNVYGRRGVLAHFSSGFKAVSIHGRFSRRGAVSMRRPVGRALFLLSARRGPFPSFDEKIDAVPSSVSRPYGQRRSRSPGRRQERRLPALDGVADKRRPGARDLPVWVRFDLDALICAASARSTRLARQSSSPRKRVGGRQRRHAKPRAVSDSGFITSVPKPALAAQASRASSQRAGERHRRERNSSRS